MYEVEYAGFILPEHESACLVVKVAQQVLFKGEVQVRIGATHVVNVQQRRV